MAVSNAHRSQRKNNTVMSVGSYYGHKSRNEASIYSHLSLFVSFSLLKRQHTLDVARWKKWRETVFVLNALEHDIINMYIENELHIVCPIGIFTALLKWNS